MDSEQKHAGQPRFFDIDDRLKRLSDLGDQLETFRAAVGFELFRPELNAALAYTDRTSGRTASQPSKLIAAYPENRDP
jgi:hypothetical protein